MKINLEVLDKKIYADLKMIGRQAESLGFTAYLVGGVVRDILLKLPSADWDIVVEGDAIELAGLIAGAAKAKLTTYEKFGTATVVLSNGDTFDFATARSEHYPQPGALPVVKAGSIKEDLFRRDFTINALAVVLNPQGFGELQDFYGGLVDLQNGNIHVLHYKSFLDDPTRILRAVRFESRLDFKLGKETQRLLKTAIADRAYLAVKPPRYFAEFRKIFSEKNPAVALKRLAALGGLNFVQPRFVLPAKTLLKINKTVPALRKKDFLKSYDWSVVYFIAFFSQQAIEQIGELAKHFHLTGKELIILKGLQDAVDIQAKLRGARLKPSQIYELLDPVELEIICFIRAVTSVNIVASRIDDFLQKWRLVSLDVTGEDLKNLGFKPGRDMGILLHTLVLRKIDGELKTRKDEIELAKRLGFNIKGVRKDGSH
jgi:tRNA nucleotidyltransferase (CCA-adding enzyme)